MSPDAPWPWHVLDLEGPAEERDVKRAYARKLKSMDRSDVEAFEGLRKAYDAARKGAQGGAPKGKARPKMSELASGAPDRPATPAPHDERDGGGARQANSNVDQVPLQDAPAPAVQKNNPAQSLAAPPEPKQTPKAAPVPLPPPVPGAAATAQDLVADIIGPQIRTAIDDIDPVALRAALGVTDSLSRTQRSQIEAIVMRALHKDLSHLSRGIAREIDAVFDWTSDALVTEQTMQRVVGRSALFARFVEAAMAGSAARRPPPVPDPPVEPIEPEGVVSLVGIILLVIHSAIETYNEAEPSFFSLFVVLVSMGLLLITTGAMIAVPLYAVRWIAAQIVRMLPERAPVRQKIITWRDWFTRHRINIFTLAGAGSMLVIFGSAWLFQPFEF